ncbi:MAG: ornithine cyclodeaminase family protein [Steroidobacteraceae bacterium]
MLVLNAGNIEALAPMTDVIECLRRAFADGAVVPPRQVLSTPGGAGDRLLLVMPAFDAAGGGVVKLSSVHPDNPAKGLPTFQGVVVVLDESGAARALLDGAAVTRRRTAAASALASSLLSRPDSARLLILGTGSLAPLMALAHCQVRPIRHIGVWGRRSERAEATADSIRALADPGVEVHAVTALADVAASADIISCCTSSVTPVLAGEWLKRGSFVDLVGSYSPQRREADDEVLQRCRIFVDTLEGALAEAGDLLDPMQRGIITRQCILGELADLVRGQVEGRRDPGEMTLFKSVGSALEDLALCRLIVERFAPAAIQPR